MARSCLLQRQESLRGAKATRLQRVKGASRRSTIFQVLRQQHQCPEGYEDYKKHVRQHFAAAFGNDTVSARVARAVDSHKESTVRALPHAQKRPDEYYEMVTTRVCTSC